MPNKNQNYKMKIPVPEGHLRKSTITHTENGASCEKIEKKLI